MPVPDAAVTPVIQLKRVGATLVRDEGTLPVLRDVSFEIRPGEILGVVGESGAGKSITGRALTGLLEPPLRLSGGEIWFSGQRIDQLDREALRRLRGSGIATIFQDPLTALNPVFTIRRQLVETIAEHTALRGRAAAARAIELMTQVGIPAPETRIDSYPHEFSGGMRQRIVIALALAGNPKLIVADEPTTALDVSIQGQIIGLLSELCRTRGMAVMLITHDMGVVASCADRVAVMYAGRVVEIGDVREVVSRPRHPYTQGLMACIPEVGLQRMRLEQITGAMPRLDALPAGCAFSERCSRAQAVCRDTPPDLDATGSHPVACFFPGTP